MILEKIKENVLFIINLLLDIQMYLLIPILVIYLCNCLNFSVIVSSFVTSSSFIGNIIGCILLPIISKRVSYKKLLPITILIQGMGIFGLSYSSNIILLFILNGVVGASYALVISDIQSVIPIVYDKSVVKKAYSKRIAVSNIGISIGVLLSGVFKEMNAYQLCFRLAFALSLISFLTIIFLFKNVEATSSSTKVEKNANIIEMLKISFKNIKLQVFNLLTFSFWIGYSFFLLAIPLFVDYKFPKFNIGVVYIINTLMIVFLQVSIVNLVTKKFEDKKIILVGLIVQALAYIFLFKTEGIVFLLIGVILYTLGEILVVPLISTFISDNSTEVDLDLNISLMMLIRYIGLSLGQIIAGYIIDYSSSNGRSMNSSWGMFSLICGVGCILFYIYLKATKEKQA